MRPTRKQIKLDVPLRLLTDDSPLELRVKGLSLGLWGDEVNELRLQVETDLETLRRMESLELCQLVEGSREPAAIEPFASDRPVGIELRLASELLTHIPTDANEAAALVQKASQGIGLDELQSEKAWFVLAVKQARDHVSTGYRTRWFAPTGTQVHVQGMPLMAEVTAHLNEQELYFEQDSEQPQILKIKNQGDNGTWSCYANTDEERSMFAFYSVAPFEIASQHRTAVAEYLCRANFGLMIGNFELDFDDGLVRFKTSVETEASRLRPLLDNLIQANLYLFDLYLPGLRAVAFEGADPAAAQP